MSLKHFNKTQDLLGKNKEKIVFFISLIMMIISSSISVYAANYLYDSAEVSYDNNISGITSDNVQGAIDELYQDANDYSSIREMIYPVGSIYISVEDDTVAKVQERFGGTWEAFGAGRTLVGMGSNGTTNYTQVEKTDGTESQSYTPAGTVGGTSITKAQLPNYTLYSEKHSHTVTASNASWGNRMYVTNASSGQIVPYQVEPNRATNASRTTSEVTITVKSGGSGNTHNHSFTGTAATISHMQPYITVYMYKRTA